MDIDTIDSIDELTSHDGLDSRDLESLIDRLEDMEPQADDDADTATEKATNWADDHAALLTCLRDLRDECSPEWRHGIYFIADSQFEDYARELASDLGYLSNRDPNPLMQCIDWSEWADLVKQDYSTATIGSTDYHYLD